MEQVYTPKIDTPAIPGYCLKYIDDAGNAPNRTATADYSWQVENNAGRIRTNTIPENVWVVGWLDFTRGMYQTYGHVFFIRRIGNSYEIHDSEVHSGSRKPYRSLDELLAWFGAYSPVFTGWSTHCDGREYSKEKEKNMASKDSIIRLYNGVLHRSPNDEDIRIRMPYSEDEIVQEFLKTDEWLTQNHQLLVALPSLIKENAELRYQLSQKGQTDAEKKLQQIKDALK